MGSRKIWNPIATIPASTVVCTKSDDGKRSLKTIPTLIPNPEQDAARMAALKRLRHRLVTLCANNTNGGNHKVKPPTLALERWLSRSALERDLHESGDNDDPLIPSTGEADPGMIKDLSRCLGPTEAQTVAQAMATDAKAAAVRISNIGKEGNDHTASNRKHLEDTRKRLKDCTKAVKKASKAVQNSLKENSSDTDSKKPSLHSSLEALTAATRSLEACQEAVSRISSARDGCNISLDTSRRPGICDVSLLQSDGTPKKPYLTISLSHLMKFVQLWNFQQETDQLGDGGNGKRLLDHKAFYKNPVATIQSMKDATLFLQFLYCCLARYEAIKGAGYQCAVPPVAFDAAFKELGLGTTIECFASPFNCRYRNYCSAFPDLERPFGSLGSFFDDGSFFPTAGSFEANPPFVPEIMVAMNEKLERVLSNPKAKALSFLVVVPVWGTAGIGYVEELEASRFVRAKARIAAPDHCFCDGAQHKAPKAELRPSSWDTAVVVLQNDAGAERWSIQQEQLEATFCAALRSSAADTTLKDWEYRGVGRGGKMTSGNNKTKFSSSLGSAQQGRNKRLRSNFHAE